MFKTYLADTPSSPLHWAFRGRRLVDPPVYMAFSYSGRPFEALTTLVVMPLLQASQLSAIN